MRRILIIGIGAGNPDYLTVQAIDALNRADAVFIPDKGQEKAALRQVREGIVARFLTRPSRLVPFDVPERAPADADYQGVVAAWHAEIAARYAALFAAHLGDEECGALLVWGDPGLFDSALRIVGAVQAGGMALAIEVIPGITAVQVLAAQHRIPLNLIGEPVVITTGRLLAAGMPAGSVVVMLDGAATFAKIDPVGVTIYWGAYLGMPQEILMAGPLAEVAEDIVRARQAARARHGWIMDVYLLRQSK